MNLQITAILSDADRANHQNITHYQLLNLDSFNLATLSSQQVVVMIESGRKISVANANGVQIPCAVNVRNLVSGITEKWIQGKENEVWTDDVLALPHIQDINGASKTRRFTTGRSQNV